MKKWCLILSWTLRVMVSLAFLFASLGKLSQNEAVIEMFSNWGFPNGFYFIVGLVEILLAIGLLIRKTLKVSLLGLGILMIGAAVTHVLNDPIIEVIRPLIFLSLLYGIYALNYCKVK